MAAALPEAPGAAPAPNPYAPPANPAPDPYAPPAAPVDVLQTAVSFGLESIRREHLNAEANIKAVAGLSLLGGVLTSIFTVGILAVILPLRRSGASLLIGGIYLVATVMLFYGGLRLLKLAPLGRILITVVNLGTVAIGVAGGGFAAAPSLWSLIILYVLWCRKAGTVFSEHYRTVVVPATPHIKYRVSPLIWGLLALLLLALVGGVLAGVFGPARHHH